MKRTSLRSGRESHNRHSSKLVLLAAAGLACSSVATASNITWNRAAGNQGNFSDGVNWAGGTMPGSADTGFLDNGGIAGVATVIGPVTSLRLGTTAGSS